MANQWIAFAPLFSRCQPANPLAVFKTVNFYCQLGLFSRSMPAQIPTPESQINQIVTRIFSTHRITRSDQKIFMATLLAQDSLSPEAQNQINRVFDGLRQGLLRVVD